MATNFDWFMVEFSDLYVNLGDYNISLLHISHDEPRKPWVITPHAHTVYELHCISKGNGILYTPNEKYDMTPGTICLTGPGIYHGQTSEIENSNDEYTLRFNIEQKTNSSADREESELIKAIIDNPFFITKIELDIVNNIEKILHEAHLQQKGFRKRIECIFCLILTELGRFSSGLEKRTDILPRRCEMVIGEVDLKCKLDIYMFYYDDPVPIEKILSDLHITRRHFNRLMQKYYGMSYTEKITQLRIEYSKQLLLDTDISVADISAKVGYSTPGQFIRQFKLCENVTPGKFRQTRKKA